MPWTDAQLAYLAGIVDGEGTITITSYKNSRKGKGKEHGRYGAKFSIINCDEGLMLWLVENFGGSSRPMKRNKINKAHRISYVWDMGERAATPVISAICPFLVIKKAQALLYLEFRGTRNVTGAQKHGLSEKVVEMREIVVDKIKFLNRKGPRDVVA
jgi:hypothetical protein